MTMKQAPGQRLLVQCLIITQGCQRTFITAAEEQHHSDNKHDVVDNPSVMKRWKPVSL